MNLRSPGSQRDTTTSTPRTADRKRTLPDSDVNPQATASRRRVQDETPTKQYGSLRRDRIIPNSTPVAGPTNANHTLRYVSLTPVPLASGNEVRPEWRVEAEEINRKGRAAWEAKMKKRLPN